MNIFDIVRYISRQPREYPTGFGQRLLHAYRESCQLPQRLDLRRKYSVNPDMSDRELFSTYPLNNDQWFDANLPAAFWYLAGSRFGHP